MTWRRLWIRGGCRNHEANQSNWARSVEHPTRNQKVIDRNESFTTATTLFVDNPGLIEPIADLDVTKLAAVMLEVNFIAVGNACEFFKILTGLVLEFG